MLGKHFRIERADNVQFSRHYTICNVMEPTRYQAYCAALRDTKPLDSDLFSSSAQSSMRFTIKNYNKP